MKKAFFFTLVILIAFCFATVDAVGQSVKYKADEILLSHIDTNTLKLRSKLFPFVPKGDLNIYGFEETDVPIYADSVYAYRLSILESEVPMDYNEYVRPYIDLYSIRKRKLTSKVLAWSSYYFPIFEEALDRAGMPLELKYLAVIESALNPMATSPVGAAGMWQFMAPTGRIYGLKTNYNYDERRDVLKSTEAAIKYLQNSYRIYGDWLLVIASYNCGPGNVNKAIKRAGGVKNFWAIQRYLPKETRGYVPAFIAATYVMNYASEHNLYPSEEVAMNYFVDTVHIDNRYTLQQLSEALCMDADEIRKMNPSLKKGHIPFSAQKISLTLPYAKAIQLASLFADTCFKNTIDKNYIALNNSARTNNETKTIIYKVRKGDLLADIAARFDISIREIKRWNKIRGNKLTAGKKLKLKVAIG